MPAKRTCGACNLCCKLPPIWERSSELPEFVKPRAQWCTHAVRPGGGCAIHADPRRPVSCRMFRCLWIKGYGPDDGRPDQIGAVFSESEVTPLGRVLEIYLSKIRDATPKRLGLMVDEVMSKRSNLRAAVFIAPNPTHDRLAFMRGERIPFRLGYEPGVDPATPAAPVDREEMLALISESAGPEALESPDLDMEQILRTALERRPERSVCRVVVEILSTETGNVRLSRECDGRWAPGEDVTELVLELVPGVTWKKAEIEAAFAEDERAIVQLKVIEGAGEGNEYLLMREFDARLGGDLSVGRVGGRIH